MQQLNNLNLTRTSALEITAYTEFDHWLDFQYSGITFSNYLADKTFFIDLQSNGKLSIFESSLIASEIVATVVAVLSTFKTNQTIANGLSVPHPPLFYQVKLWLLNFGERE